MVQRFLAVGAGLDESAAGCGGLARIGRGLSRRTAWFSSRAAYDAAILSYHEYMSKERGDSRVESSNLDGKDVQVRRTRLGFLLGRMCARCAHVS